MNNTSEELNRLKSVNAKLLAAARRGVMALEANGAPNYEAAKELRAAIVKTSEHEYAEHRNFHI